LLIESDFFDLESLEELLLPLLPDPELLELELLVPLPEDELLLLVSLSMIAIGSGNQPSSTSLPAMNPLSFKI